MPPFRIGNECYNYVYQPKECRTIGRRIFGAAAIGFGLIALVWHSYSDRDLLHGVWFGATGPALVYAVAGATIVGGLTIQFPRVAQGGAVALGAVYLFFAALCITRIATSPQVYDSWGNFFEQFSLVLGATFVYASMSRTSQRLQRIGSMLFGLCVVSFALEQAVHLGPTAGLVPRWLPPNQMFWAVATTVAFAFAAVALVANRSARLAARSLTAMIASFGFVVWVPLLIAQPKSNGNWSETVETFAIAGSAWLLADFLSKSRKVRQNTTVRG